MEATPFGVFALIANAVAANGAAVFVNVGWLALAVVLGSLIQIRAAAQSHPEVLRGCR
jgi:Na+/H+-dicarboxylate symporter